MKTSLYTNTGKVGSIIGLVATTVLLSYATTHSTEIVEGTIRIVKNGVDFVKSNIKYRKAKRDFSHVCGIDFNGKIYDTGKVIKL